MPQLDCLDRKGCRRSTPPGLPESRKYRCHLSSSNSLPTTSGRLRTMCPPSRNIARPSHEPHQKGAPPNPPSATSLSRISPRRYQLLTVLSCGGNQIADCGRLVRMRWHSWIQEAAPPGCFEKNCSSICYFTLKGYFARDSVWASDRSVTVSM